MSTPAFPQPGWMTDKAEERYGGLSKLEYFAAMAMQGLLANPDPEVQCTNMPANAVGYASALIAELNKVADTK